MFIGGFSQCIWEFRKRPTHSPKTIFLTYRKWSYKHTPTPKKFELLIFLYINLKILKFS